MTATVIYMDGFDHYGVGGPSNTNMLAGNYSAAQNVFCEVPPWGASRTGTYCLRGNGFGPSGLVFSVPTPGTHFFQSFGFAVDSLISGLPRIAEWRDGSGNVLFYLLATVTGALQFWAIVSSTATLLGATSGPVIVPENWHFFEMEINSSANTFKLRVDDAAGTNTPVMSITNADITGTIAQMAFLTVTGGALAQIDDLFIRNSSSSWLGDRRVATLLADGDTTTAGWSANRYTKLGAGILNNTSTTNNGAMVGTSTSTSLNIGSADFTLETFVRFQSLPTGSNKSVIFSRWDQPNNQRSYELFLGSQSLNGGSLCWQTSTDGTGSTITQSIIYPWVPQLDTWYHIAMVRASGELLLFVNGQQFGLPIADSTTYFAGTSPFGLGGEFSGSSSGNQPNTQLIGWLDETRFTNGFARYTANFTPTTVEFPRNVGGDPEWADVVLLCGYDTLIQDESGFSRALVPNNGAVQQTPNDASTIGTWPVIGKSVPDDNTFIEAPFTNATSILTVTVNPSNTNTVTVGTTDGSTPAVYTFKTALSTAFDVLIDTNIQNTLQNLYNAINAGPGAGTKYGTSTTANFDVNASQLPAGQMMVTANTAGTAGNSIATSKSGITGSWTSTTLAGGLDIPGPSNFKVQRLPPNTTLISAVQIAMRSFKSDSGVGSINSALVGALGGVATGTTHNLTVSPIYYNDVYEIDPDTSGPISPTTIINGAIQVNRDT